MGKTVAQITKGVAALIVAIIFDWKIVIVAVIVGPILAIILRKLAKRVRRGSRGSLAAQQEMLKHSTEIMHGLRAVKTSTAEAESEADFEKVNLNVVKHELRMRVARAMSGPIVETLAILVLSLLAAIASKSILSGSLPFDRFILALGSLAVAGASFRPLAGIINEISAAAAPAQRISEILDRPIEPQTQTGPRLPRHAETIQFERVDYAYPDTDSLVLRDISLSIRFGERIAIVGPNGSGKTTLLGLLPRLLVPNRGKILIDGFDIADVQLESLRRQVGVVTQEAFVMHGTVRQNIAFGVDDVDDAAIEEAARIAHATEFINDLPQGMDTIIAEGGASLSGGQRQRLSIARALIRHPSILILDEATSQVDSESEVAIRDAIHDAGVDRTMLIIAHRMASVIDADRIVVLSRGQIVDVGSHEELLGRCDAYVQLTKTQLVGADR
jgi:subfamily B ATP-binding cassette protein MsbA